MRNLIAKQEKNEIGRQEKSKYRYRGKVDVRVGG